MEQSVGGQKGKERWGEGRGGQLLTFSTDCPLTNIIRLALCVHVQCIFNNSTQLTTPLALHFTSPIERARRNVFEGGWSNVQTAGWRAE